jgi:hypothetical protein
MFRRSKKHTHDLVSHGVTQRDGQRVFKVCDSDSAPVAKDPCMDTLSRKWQSNPERARKGIGRSSPVQPHSQIFHRYLSGCGALSWKCLLCSCPLNSLAAWQNCRFLQRLRDPLSGANALWTES